MILELVRQGWNVLSQLNLFKTEESTEATSQREIWATRIYLISVPMTVLTIGLVSGLIVKTVDNTEVFPSINRFNKLIQQYPDTLSCPCSRIGITYEAFITANANFHQVCSSHFIQASWIESLFNETSFSFDETFDFRRTLPFFWQNIASLCDISSKTWAKAISSFKASYFFSPEAMSKDYVIEKTKAELDKSILEAGRYILQNLQLLQKMMSGNQLVSALSTNFYLGYPPSIDGDWFEPKMSPRYFDNCSCVRNSGCPRPATIKTLDGQLLHVLGLIADCLVVDGTLLSSLDCYYDLTCVSALHGWSINRTKLLSVTHNQFFSINSTIQDLLNRMMIDEVIIDIDVDKYYDQCRPSFCSYSYSRRFYPMFVGTMIVGTLGGVLFVLHYVALFVVQIYEKMKLKNDGVSSEQDTSQTRPTRHIPIEKVNQVFLSARNKVITLNLFKSEINNGNKQQQELLLTRLFIITLISCISIYCMYLMISSEEETIKVIEPDENEYAKLFHSYSNSLTCSCSQMSIMYSEFLNVTFKLHQVCSSDLISSEWIYYLLTFNPSTVPVWSETIFSRDFRMFGGAYFQFLKSFCSLATINIQEHRNYLEHTALINSFLLSVDAFNQTASYIVEKSIQATLSRFSNILLWINMGNIINQYLTGTNTNFDFEQRQNELALIDRTFQTLISISNDSISTMSPCRCSESAGVNCKIALFLFEEYASSVLDLSRYLHEVPLGCIPIVGFNASLIDWWYDQDYIEDIRNTYSLVIISESPPLIRALNRSIPTRYNQSRVFSLLESMFIEDVIIHPFNYTQFYKKCSPKWCIYRVVKKRSAFMIALLLTAIIDGLSEALKIFMPFFYQIFMKVYHRLRSRLAFNDHRHQMCVQCKNIFSAIKNYNIFETHKDDIHLQFSYTRIYIVLLMMVISITIFYSSLIERSLTKTIIEPNLVEFNDAIELYRDRMRCPCKTIAIPYNQFVTQLAVSSYHPACSSSILTAAYLAGTPLVYLKVDFGVNFYSWRRTFIDGVDRLCRIAKKTVELNVEDFLSSSIYVYQMIPRSDFELRVNTTIREFQRFLPTMFARFLELIRKTTKGNALIGIFSSNWKIFTTEDRNRFILQPTEYFESKTKRMCRCVLNESCTIQTSVFDRLRNETFESPEGIAYGCSLIEAILQSSFYCLFSSECIDRLRQAWFHNGLAMAPKNWTWQRFVNGSTMRYSINETIQNIAAELFIESWKSNFSYEKFFNACSPSHCTIDFRYRFDFLEVIASFLSIYAGSTVVLRYLVPHFVKLFIRFRSRLRVSTN